MPGPSLRGMDYARRIIDFPTPPGPVPIDPPRAATVTATCYDFTVRTYPVMAVERAPGPPELATWIRVRQTLGPDDEWLAWVRAESVRPT